MIIVYALRRLLRPRLVAGLLLTLTLLPLAGLSASGAGVVLVLGDSISAAYGMDLEQGWVARLQQQLDTQYPGYRVVNASISGDTTEGGRQRLPQLLSEHAPDVVILELGGNDGLRGYPLTRVRENLQAMTEQAQAAGAQVLLLAMEIPPNLGPRYTRGFRESFTLVAEETGARAAPFILDGIATDRARMQSDGIHPTAEAQSAILANVWPYLAPLLAAVSD